MTKRMLIDATHAEETRVVVLDGNRLEDFDVETATKKQLKGNIYLAKVVRVEPSLQAAFVEYGGGRHGFLAFGEIHPDYYQIPVADRQRLLALQAEEARAEDEEDDDDEAAAAAGPARTPDRQPARDEPKSPDEPTRPAPDAELGEPSRGRSTNCAAKTADERRRIWPAASNRRVRSTPAAEAEAVADGPAPHAAEAAAPPAPRRRPAPSTRRSSVPKLRLSRRPGRAGSRRAAARRR